MQTHIENRGPSSGSCRTVALGRVQIIRLGLGSYQLAQSPDWLRQFGTDQRRQAANPGRAYCASRLAFFWQQLSSKDLLWCATETLSQLNATGETRTSRQRGAFSLKQCRSRVAFRRGPRRTKAIKKRPKAAAPKSVGQPSGCRKMVPIRSLMSAIHPSDCLRAAPFFLRASVELGLDCLVR